MNMGDAKTKGAFGGRTHLRIHLINGSVRSIKCTERVEMQVSDSTAGEVETRNAERSGATRFASGCLFFIATRVACVLGYRATRRVAHQC